MKYLSLRKQEEIKELVYKVMIILRTNIKDIKVVGKGYDALLQEKLANKIILITFNSILL